jgi:hypothetical protein
MKWAAVTRAWMPTAMRPDIHPAPVQRMAATPSGGRELPSDGGGKAMPTEVQAKMEGSFGTDFSSVRIHEGPRSQALGARAYTQGNQLHFAPGEYQPGSESGQALLGHELAHVVQQRQGRVQATTQAKGVGVNDDSALEREADEMGARAARGERVNANAHDAGPTGDTGIQLAADPNAAPVQMARYMRALNGDDRVDNEVTSLRREFENETNRQHQVNTWVDGFAGMPTARHNGTDVHYYSPVGYELEVTDNNDVWANFRGDGNTNDIPVTTDRWVEAANAMRTQVIQVEDYQTWLLDEEAREDDPYGLEIPEVDGTTGTAARESLINYYLTPYLEASSEPEGRAAGQQAVRDAISNSGLDALRTHYGENHDEVQAERFIGTGVDPEGMEEALEAPDVRYIESILHAKFNQVRRAWYNRDLGNYSEAAAQENWRTGENWLDNRRGSAEAVRDAFNNAGANNIQVQVIGPEPEEEEEDEEE